MVTLTLSASLFALLPDPEQHVAERRRSVRLNATSWEDAVLEIRRRFASLAARVFTESGVPARGFVVVVNDDVVRLERESIVLKDGDELCLLAALAGG